MKVVKRNKLCIPIKIKKIGSPEHLVGSCTSLLIFCIAFQFLGPCSKKRGSRQSKKCTFQIYLICASNGGQGTKQMFISPFWGDVGVKKLSPLLRSVTSDDVGQKCQFSGRSVLHRISSNMCPDADNFLKHSWFMQFWRKFWCPDSHTFSSNNFGLEKPKSANFFVITVFAYFDRKSYS